MSGEKADVVDRAKLAAVRIMEDCRECYRSGTAALLGQLWVEIESLRARHTLDQALIAQKDERIAELERQDEVHWKTRRSHLKQIEQLERDAVRYRFIRPVIEGESDLLSVAPLMSIFGEMDKGELDEVVDELMASTGEEG
jgi:hypothetical protein